MGLKVESAKHLRELCFKKMFQTAQEEYNEKVSHATIQGDVTLSHEKNNFRPFTGLNI